MNLRITLLACALVSINVSLFGVIKQIKNVTDTGISGLSWQGSEDGLESLVKMATLIGKTGSSTKDGISIGNLVKPNRKFIAQMGGWGFNRYFVFDTKEDADHIQLGCYNGASMDVRWYYLDVNRPSTPKKEESDSSSSSAAASSKQVDPNQPD